MLRELQIRNLVLIEDASLTFSPRFNVLTGETGAGKSLIATSLDLLLGDRATSALVRKEAREAEVEGIFDIGDEPLVRAALEEAGLPVDDELLIRRIIPADGRHRCFINGRVASLGVLGTLAAGLATSMSQHAHQELFEPERQLALLDGFAGSGTLLEKVSALFGTLQRQQDDLSQLLSQDRDRAARMDYLAYQLDEFDRVSPQDGEMALLEKELSVLRHQTTLLEGTNACAGELYETDGSIFERLGNLSKSSSSRASMYVGEILVSFTTSLMVSFFASRVKRSFSPMLSTSYSSAIMGFFIILALGGISNLNNPPGRFMSV